MNMEKFHEQFIQFKPSTLTIIPTYKCTAECSQCCFESNPRIKKRLGIKELLDYIDQVKKDFPTIKLVVFTGGECFLLHKDLCIAIEHVHNYGIATRCVTNGYWASTEKMAQKKLIPLYEAGLTELNFSTGDDHQTFVPFQNIYIGAISAAKIGIETVIVVEGYEESKFKSDDIFKNTQMKNFLDNDPAKHRIRIMNNVWIPFKTNSRISQSDKVYRKKEKVKKSEPE